MSEPDCVFCKIIGGEIPATLVAEEKRAVALMDIRPATRGHLLVIPRAHARDVFTADPEDVAAVAQLAQEMAIRVRDRLGADGVNLIQSNGRAAWQEIFHLHVHVIPRYVDDPLVMPWTPAQGDPEELTAIAAELAAD